MRIIRNPYQLGFSPREVASPGRDHNPALHPAGWHSQERARLGQGWGLPSPGESASVGGRAPYTGWVPEALQGLSAGFL